MNISVSLGGLKQVLLVEVMFKSSPPKGMILLKSVDSGTAWTPIQYFAQNCQESFNMTNLERLDSEESINCDERFSDPISGTTVTFYLLEDSRPGSRDFEENPALQKWSFARHLRLSMTSFHGNVSEKTAYFSISEISVFGRMCECVIPGNTSSCSCNGTVIRPDCRKRVWFDSAFYERSVTCETPQGADILQGV